MLLELKNLCKTYGDNKALTNISFDINEGEILGIIGRKGSGKTTIIKSIMGIVSPDEGEIFYKNADNNTGRIGYLPEEGGLYDNLNVTDQLLFFAMIHGLDRKTAMEQISYWLSEFEMSEYRNEKVKRLSAKYKQRLGIISAILHNPDLVILDEVFSGIDIDNKLIIKNVMHDLKERGLTVLFTSYRIEDVEELCDHVILISGGNIIADTTVENLRKLYLKENSIIIKTKESIKTILDNIGIEAIENDYLEYECIYKNNEDIKLLNKEIALAGIEVIEMKHANKELQNIQIKELAD